jgi:hypothetical protein
MGDAVLVSQPAFNITEYSSLWFIHVLCQIYRCFVIWNRRKLVILAPALLLLASIISK